MALKVLCVVDKEKTALDRLAQGVKPYHSNIDYNVVAVHPKRPDQKQLDEFLAYAMDADIIDWQYFRTAEMLRDKFDLPLAKHILTHNNPYSITESDWNNYDHVVGNNKTICQKLDEITTQPISYIPITVDVNFWDYNQDWQAKPKVIMVANRIESKKGILPVAIACAELNWDFVLVGAISDVNYFNDIMATGKVLFYEQITDEELRDLYYKSGIHVCNSVDNFESGTMPVLEAMLCGTPVMSRLVGHVPDIYNGENMVIYKGDTEDVLAIKDCLETMYFDKKALMDMRDKAWNSAKNFNFERRAVLYQRLYRSVLNPSVPVSVILPICDKPDITIKTLTAIAEQTYPNLEIVVIDDGMESQEKIVRDWAKTVNLMVRYIDNSRGDYGLARARNVGVIEATGDVLVFCDQRMQMDKYAVEVFLDNLRPKKWLYGNKGGKKEFVENFSCAYRREVIGSGMFCERMDAYGGLSQETRTRIRLQGIVTEYIENAKATPMGKSSNKFNKKQDIARIKNRLFKMYEVGE